MARPDRRQARTPLVPANYAVVRSQIDPLVRWQLNRYYSSLFGSNVVAEVRPSSITFLHGEITTELPWTSITAIKANDEVLVFLKGRAPLAIMPASAFESPARRDAFVSLVRTRIPHRPDWPTTRRGRFVHRANTRSGGASTWMLKL